jgi:hypothetical protein
MKLLLAVFFREYGKKLAKPWLKNTAVTLSETASLLFDEVLD